MRLRQAHGLALRAASERSLTLLRVFLAASALILAIGAVVLSTVLTHALNGQALADNRDSLTLYVDGVLRPALVRDHRLRVDPRVSAALVGELHRDHDLVTVKVWRPDGVLAWTNRAPERIGKRFEAEEELAAALHGRAAGSIGELSADENRVERSLGFSHLLQVYAPILDSNGKTVLGAYEIYADPKGLEATIASRRHMLWAAVGVVFLALWAALALLVRGASAILRRQTRQLRERSKALLEAYGKLEESSLEAIESLNATVEAKDPATAGHSRRVQRISLALGEELGLAPKRLDNLRFGALFHDIGKIAVPDAILVKPGKLDDLEYTRMKTHSAEGARIVEKFGRLRDAVPIILHHHERWDGQGYPHRLAEDEIPLEAAVVGLADAWDAMTTDRPYHRALTIAEAFAEVTAGRGKQFSPEVVDAFHRTARRRPVELGLEEPTTGALQAG
jgi:putative nucleotidyltransferase with HDIG domain